VALRQYQQWEAMQDRKSAPVVWSHPISMKKKAGDKDVESCWRATDSLFE
jgi:hypothetical protein